MTKLDSSQGHKDGSTYTTNMINNKQTHQQRKDKNYISIDAEKASDKIQNPLMIKNLLKQVKREHIST